MMLAINVCSVMVFHYVMHMPAVGYLSGFTASCVAYNGWRSLSMDSQKVRYLMVPLCNHNTYRLDEQGNSALVISLSRPL